VLKCPVLNKLLSVIVNVVQNYQQAGLYCTVIVMDTQQEAKQLMESPYIRKLKEQRPSPHYAFCLFDQDQADFSKQLVVLHQFFTYPTVLITDKRACRGTDFKSCLLCKLVSACTFESVAQLQQIFHCCARSIRINAGGTVFWRQEVVVGDYAGMVK